MSPDLELALRLADAADAIALPLFRTGLAVERKPDSTPVTEADRAVETELLRLLAEALPDVARHALHVRAFGDFWSHMLVAEGAVDGAFEATGVREWDLAAVQVIVEEAGGRFSDLSGTRRIDGGTALTSNGVLHDRLLSATAVRRSP